MKLDTIALTTSAIAITIILATKLGPGVNNYDFFFDALIGWTVIFLGIGMVWIKERR